MDVGSHLHNLHRNFPATHLDTNTKHSPVVSPIPQYSQIGLIPNPLVSVPIRRFECFGGCLYALNCVRFSSHQSAQLRYRGFDRDRNRDRPFPRAAPRVFLKSEGVCVRINGQSSEKPLIFKFLFEILPKKRGNGKQKKVGAGQLDWWAQSHGFVKACPNGLGKNHTRCAKWPADGHSTHIFSSGGNLPHSTALTGPQAQLPPPTHYFSPCR